MAATEDNPDVVLKKIFFITMVGSAFFIGAGSFITYVMTGATP